MVEWLAWVIRGFDAGSAVIGMIVGVMLTWCAARDWYSSPMLTTVSRRVPMLEAAPRRWKDPFRAGPDGRAKVRNIDWR